MKRLCHVSGAGVLVLGLAVMVTPAQQFSNAFSFALPPDDSLASACFPTCPFGPVSAQDAVTVDGSGPSSIHGSPIRFFGVNLVADGAFPPPSKASFFAARLRKMGVNLGRFHHVDHPWSAWSLFAGAPSTRVINETARGMFEYMLARLREQGIYSNVNLHVGRTFRAADGIPDADSLNDICKAINSFDPAFLALCRRMGGQPICAQNAYVKMMRMVREQSGREFMIA